MLCESHQAAAVFYSEKEGKYVCFKCLVDSEKLLYIGQSYKQDLEEFELIKKKTEEAITNALGCT